MTKNQMQQVLDALQCVIAQVSCPPAEIDDAIAIMQAAVDAPEVEPVAWLHKEHQVWVVLMPPPDTGNWYPVFAAPQERKPLSDEQIRMVAIHSDTRILYQDYTHSYPAIVRAVEAMHGITGAING